jgi:hypothetical protein
MKNTLLRRLALAGSCALIATPAMAADSARTTTPVKVEKSKGDWAQWGGSPERNNVPEGHDIPTEWNIGEFDYKTGEWNPAKSKNVKWVARLGSQSYGNAVVSGGHVYLGTNNSGGWL